MADKPYFTVVKYEKDNALYYVGPEINRDGEYDYTSAEVYKLCAADWADNLIEHISDKEYGDISDITLDTFIDILATEQIPYENWDYYLDNFPDFGMYFDLTGEDAKAYRDVISDSLNWEEIYDGLPTYGIKIGDEIDWENDLFEYKDPFAIPALVFGLFYTEGFMFEYKVEGSDEWIPASVSADSLSRNSNIVLILTDERENIEVSVNGLTSYMEEIGMDSFSDYFKGICEETFNIPGSEAKDVAYILFTLHRIPDSEYNYDKVKYIWIYADTEAPSDISNYVTERDRYIALCKHLIPLLKEEIITKGRDLYISDGWDIEKYTEENRPKIVDIRPFNLSIFDEICEPVTMADIEDPNTGGGDGDSEITKEAFTAWCAAHGIEHFMRPGMHYGVKDVKSLTHATDED